MGREVKRVPLDFDWPRERRWEGYIMPDKFRELPCQICVQPLSRLGEMFGHEPTGDGLTPAARAIANTFYPHQISGHDSTRREQLAWYDKIGQAEVDNLVEHGHLHEFGLWDRVELPEPWEMIGEGDHKYPRRFEFVRNDTPTPTAAEVNARQHMFGPFGHHGGSNRDALITFRCKVLGIDMFCEGCGGRGTVEAYEGQRAEAEQWERTDPPAGEGWQLWETVSEGSPVSPVFATAEELAQWLTTPEGGYQIGPSGQPMTISQARAFINAGSAPSMILDSGGLHDGAQYVGTQAVLEQLKDPDEPPSPTDP